jgi:5'-deoxynucleotidase YfbR-like HD superfamily hydrolase
MLTTRDRLRSRSVDRWHTVLTSTKQNIAEHSHCMGIIAEALLEEIYNSTADSLQGKSPSIEERYAVLKYAQLHDLPEVVTGDMSSPFKRFLKERLAGFDALMDEVEHSLLPELEKLNEYMNTEQRHLPIVLKMADMLEAYSYFLVGRGLDVQHNDVVLGKLNEYLTTLVNTGEEIYPEFNWQACWTLREDIADGDSVVLDFEKALDAIRR